mmetsp:Transcript_32313/g.82084  ORF Transcript_32313/g.82084 Transcript_32313/m.82084 type:complete len:233 (-) Transcript_32313:3455-4153(-)
MALPGAWHHPRLPPAAVSTIHLRLPIPLCNPTHPSILHQAHPLLLHAVPSRHAAALRAQRGPCSAGCTLTGTFCCHSAAWVPPQRPSARWRVGPAARCLPRTRQRACSRPAPAAGTGPQTAARRPPTPPPCPRCPAAAARARCPRSSVRGQGPRRSVPRAAQRLRRARAATAAVRASVWSRQRMGGWRAARCPPTRGPSRMPQRCAPPRRRRPSCATSRAQSPWRRGCASRP